MIQKQIILAIALLTTAGCGWPGGMPPTYPAKNNDPKLTKYAESLAPIIKAIESFKDQHSRFPKDTAEVLAELPNPMAEKNRWHYHADDNGYWISIKLGWDPSLTYDGSKDVWIFEPGDGSPETQIKLDVDTTR
jgi:hypothetical protein